jgi:hypothetical protein
MNQDLEQAAQPSVQEEQQSTTKADQPQSLSPTPVSTVSVTQTPEQIAAQFGTPAPAQVAQAAPQAAQQDPAINDLLFDPSPMNPAQPAPPVEVAQAPASKSDREDPSTREFDPTIFDPATFAPSAPPVEVAQAPQAAPPASPIEVAQNAPPPGQIQAPAAISGIPAGVPAGVPADVPSGVPSGAMTNDDIVSLPRQQLAMAQELQKQKDIKDKRDAIAKAMMGQDPGQGVVI